MNYLPGHVITNNYFEKKRGIAGGIVCAGAGFGVFLLAPVSQLLLSEYGWRGAMLILGGIFMQLCVCSTLMRPLIARTKGVSDVHSKYSSVACEHEDRDLMLKPQDSDETLTGRVETVASHEQYRTDDNSDAIKEKLSQYHINNRDPLIRLKLTDRCYSDHALTNHHKHVEVNKFTKSLQEFPKIPVEETPQDLTKSQFLEPVAFIAQEQQLVEDKKQEMHPYQKRRKTIRETLRSWRVISCDMSIFRHKSYIPLLLGGVFIQMGQFIPNTFLPEYCLTIGLDGKQISIIMALYGK